ncbi:MAG TPA: hypothetical protein DDW27_15080 [Bacteroidales bacterium]|nr:hypothetical protein [Bacteroidales bacterium]
MTENNINNIYYKRNNLDRSSSPYLLQHSHNPIWWQEWTNDTLNFALKENKPLLVSIGYATCHWCHVMAAEAFSDTGTAEYINENYISIKVDREQRPDIDQYMMHFIQTQSGSGGWPLNVFLTPDAKPVVAITYAPATSVDGRLSFFEIAKRIKDYMESNRDSIYPFNAIEDEPPTEEENFIVGELESYHDDEYGGFGAGQKFPPHSILLFLLHFHSAKENPEIIKMITSTLDSIILGGLNDHLQGGIFRYCVDRGWTIPHFEKMLYDQALALWTFSLGYKVTGNNNYKTMAEKILRCLKECFEDNGLYVSAFNADTDNKEGSTYLWSRNELENLLGKDDFGKFCEIYHITGEGNFEGKNHLVRKNHDPLYEIEDKLLAIRKKRNQPSVDNKILCGINAQVAVAMIQAGRFLDKPELEKKADDIIKKLLGLFWDGSSLGHSFYNGLLQKRSFLSDAGAILTAITMLYENDEKWTGMMRIFSEYTAAFKEEGRWIESKSDDFRTVNASWTDQPVPSGISLAENGLTRYALLTGREVKAVPYRRPAQSDFYNINALMCNDLFHLYTTKKLLPWKDIPANSLQKRGEPETDCFNKVCRLLN